MERQLAMRMTKGAQDSTTKYGNEPGQPCICLRAGNIPVSTSPRRQAAVSSCNSTSSDSADAGAGAGAGAGAATGAGAGAAVRESSSACRAELAVMVSVSTPITSRHMLCSASERALHTQPNGEVARATPKGAGWFVTSWVWNRVKPPSGSYGYGGGDGVLQ
jgi:hypothetical protein